MKIKYTVDLGVAGEHECLVHFDYQPRESRTHDYPGCDESYDVWGVFTKDGMDITALVSGYLNDSAMFYDAVHELMTGEEK